MWVGDGWLEQYDRVKETFYIGTQPFVREYNQLRNEFIYFNWGWHNYNNPQAPYNGWYQYDLFDAWKEAGEGNMLIDYETELTLDAPDVPDPSDNSADLNAYIYEKGMIINIRPK